MKSSITVGVVIALLLTSNLCAAGISGEWIATLTDMGTGMGEPQYARVKLEADGSRITGTWGDYKVDGTVTGDHLTLSLVDSNGKAAGSLNGVASGEQISGGGSMAMRRRAGSSAEKVAVAWKLARMPHAPAGGPKTWNYEPKVFYSYYSAAQAPVLRIFPGDTVRTSTIDSGGLGPKMERYMRGGNPETGPFYIDGALPGDTLVVKLNKVRLNRDTARQGNRITPHAVTAAYFASADYSPEFNSEWKLDREKNIATMAHPTERMKNFTVPILPMVGCLAVAPPGDEVYRSLDLGPFGGNMDYNQNGEGTTLYFPVFHPGAGFFLGDAHAAMGDGELTGGALETSMDIEFTVDLIKGYATAAPRAETSDYIISFGIAGSIPEAIQNATTQLADWLKKDYKLNDNEVAVLLGAVLKYDITEMVDPKYNVVAKVPKSALATLAR